MKVHSTVHIILTELTVNRPENLAEEILQQTQKLEMGDICKYLIKVGNILSHHRKRSGYQWLTLIEEEADQHAEWKPRKYFVD